MIVPRRTYRLEGSLLIGVGAGLTLIVLLVLQSMTGSGLFGTRNVTVTTSYATAPPYKVFFIQQPVYGCFGLFQMPWEVELGNTTIMKPANSSMTVDAGLEAVKNLSLSVITFSVPEGTYNYTVLPTYAFGNLIGSVVVNDSGVDITVTPVPPVTCGF